MNASQLISSGRTLTQVNAMLLDGQITESVATNFFRVWAANKFDHRWNEETGYPEELRQTSNGPMWRRMVWG